MTEILEFLASNAGTISALAAAIGLSFTAYQLHKNSKIERGNFWLKLEEMFQHYDDFYQHLRFNRGKWFCMETIGPASPKQMNDLCDYLGLFEHCNLLIKQRIIDLPTFRSIYRTRVMGLLSNGVIRNGELSQKAKWSEFYDLLVKLKLAEVDNDGNPSLIDPPGGWATYIKSGEWRK